MSQEAGTPYPRALTSPTFSRRGIVCSTSTHAASIGAAILRSGGNAVDAAVATAAAEGVANAPMCGAGGDAVALVYDARRRQVFGVDGIGRIPAAIQREYQGRRIGQGAASIAVPGEVAAWDSLLRAFGTLPLPDLLEPAAEMADEGVPISAKLGNIFIRDAERIRTTPGLATLFDRGGSIVGSGDSLKLPAVAKTLRRIARHGAREFYEGEVARQLVAELAAAGAQITPQDLARQDAPLTTPLTSPYRRFSVFETRPPSKGHALLDILAVLQHFELERLEPRSADLAHVIAEVIKTVASDPFDGASAHINRERAGLRARSVDVAQAASLRPGPVGAAASTSSFCVADAQGNLVTYIHSLGNTLGSGIVAGELGLLMNNALGHSDGIVGSAERTHAADPRPSRAINCWMVFDDTRPIALGGTLGGDFQVQGSAQVLVNLLDFSMAPPLALDAPRFHVTTDPAAQRYLLRPEPNMPTEVIAALERMGHELAPPAVGFTHGLFQLIVLDHDRGLRIGVADTRGDGHPCIE